jgi:class 3 adenylate cyclase/lipopolysaccharide biosynthesis regulator YciM
MKRIIAATFLVTLTLSGHSQMPSDSLWNIWQNENNHDTVRLEALKDFIQGEEFHISGFMAFQPDSAYALNELLLEMATTKGYKEYEIWAVRLKGGYHQLMKAEFAQGVEYFEDALAIAEEFGDDQLILMSLITLGNGAIQVDPAKAEKNFRTALNRIELESLKSPEPTSDYGSKLVYYATNALQGIGTLRHYVYRDYEAALEYLQDEELIARQNGLEDMQLSAMVRIGWVLVDQGNFAEAINYLSMSLAMAEERKDNHYIGHILQTFGELYARVGETSKGQEYMTQAVDAMVEARGLYNHESLQISTNLSISYQDQKLYSKSIEGLFKNLEIADSISKSSYMIPYILGGIAENYRLLGESAKGHEYATRALEISNLAWLNPQLHLIIGNNFRVQGQYASAISWCEKSLAHWDIRLQQFSCECLYESYKALGMGNKALEYHEKYMALTDSLHKDDIAKNLLQMEFNKQMLEDSIAKVEQARLVEEAHQEEIRQEQGRRNAFMMGGFGVLIIAGGLWSRLRYIRRSKAELQTEKDRSENLLLNILPEEIAEELKTKGKADARDFEKVSILFTDFKEFTETSSELTAQELVEEINYCFEAFDNICALYEVEKIKTIGDAYMAAGGLPVPTPDSTKNTVMAAIKMQEFIKQRKETNSAEGKPAFEMRAGIHTGPIVAGIVGVKKFQYDVWGDTVNTASRVESNGEVGKVNISQETYELIKDDLDFTFSKREEIEVKGKGKMAMYFVA